MDSSVTNALKEVGSQRKLAGLAKKKIGRSSLNGAAGSCDDNNDDVGGSVDAGTGLARLHGIVEAGIQHTKPSNQHKKPHRYRHQEASVLNAAARSHATQAHTQRSLKAREVKAAERMERYLTKLVKNGKGRG